MEGSFFAVGQTEPLDIARKSRKENIPVIFILDVLADGDDVAFERRQHFTRHLGSKLLKALSILAGCFCLLQMQKGRFDVVTAMKALATILAHQISTEMKNTPKVMSIA